MRFLSNNYFSFGEIGVRVGKSIHAKVIRTPVDGDFEILNYLFKLHGARWSPKDASLVFNSMKFKTIVTCNQYFNALIVGGCAKEAIQVFYDLETIYIHTMSTYVTLITGCAHCNLYDEGNALCIVWKDA